MPDSPVTDQPRRPGPLLALLAGALALLPFLALCWYAHPSADDFLTANDVRRHGHWGYIPFMYLQWTGRYTATVLWGLLNPVAYGHTTEGYGLVCLLLLLALPLTLYGLLRALLPQQGRLALAGAAGLLGAVYLWQLPSPAEGFYWITSGYNYLLPALLTLLGLAALARHLTAPTPTGRRRWLLLAGLLLVLSIGGNETNAIVLALVVGGGTVWHCLHRRRIEWEYVALTAVVALACAVAFLAPGNFVRMSQAARLPLLEAADRAGLTTYRQLINWLANGALPALTLLLAPLAARLARLPDALPLNRLTRYPLLLTLLIPLTLYLAMLLPWLSTSQPSPPRARNVLYLFFLLGWLLMAYGWFRRWLRRRPAATGRLPRWLQLGLAGWVLLVFALGHTRHLRGRDEADNLNNVLVAWQDWLGGAAARYDAELHARYQALRAPGWLGPEPVLPPLHEPARTLLFYDITPDPNDWSNQAYAEFFGKKTLRVQAAAQ